MAEKKYSRGPRHEPRRLGKQGGAYGLSSLNRNGSGKKTANGVDRLRRCMSTGLCNSSGAWNPHHRISELGGSWADHQIQPLYVADEETKVECFAQDPS